MRAASGCSQRRKGDPRDADDRSSPLAANARIPRAESRADLLKNQRPRGISMVQARVGLAANGVVRCGRLQPTLEDGQADRRGNCRDVNQLESGTYAVTLARRAATTRGSPGARRSQPIEWTANAKPAAVQNV